MFSFRQKRQSCQEPTHSATNKFAFALLGQLLKASNNADKNVFFSPFSVFSAVSGLLLGSAEESEIELKKALCLKNVSDIPEHLRQTSSSILQAIEGIELCIANKLYSETSFEIKKEFLTLLKEVLQTDIEPKDFIQNRKDARLAINKWVSEVTKNKINDLLQPGTITEDTRLVLANALYFKGNWQTTFNRMNNMKKDFHVTPRKVVEVEFMVRKDYYQFARDKDLKLQMLEIPHNGGATSMVIVLPSKKFGLKAIEKKFSAKQLNKIEKKYSKKEVVLSLPRFKIEYSSDLVESFKGLGARSIFGSDANFSKISCKKDLYVSAIVHKAFVDVNEEGTEAAAATATGCTKTFRKYIPPTHKFTCDHPFLFFIKHKPTNTILFVGRYLNPDA
uniref:leukocyte elastase inhibitor-like n=1 Tax=Styela clava TaxID=7725 RepID=UPI001939BBED|nr:leukocyte elastase inhibitor-like [Styela clava]